MHAVASSTLSRTTDRGRARPPRVIGQPFGSAETRAHVESGGTDEITHLSARRHSSPGRRETVARTASSGYSRFTQSWTRLASPCADRTVSVRARGRSTAPRAAVAHRVEHDAPFGGSRLPAERRRRPGSAPASVYAPGPKRSSAMQAGPGNTGTTPGLARDEATAIRHSRAQKANGCDVGRRGHRTREPRTAEQADAPDEGRALPLARSREFDTLSHD